MLPMALLGFLEGEEGTLAKGEVFGGHQSSHLLCLGYAGYYYDLDDSYDESDEEEVRAHLRCVAEQPPLKLDTSSEVGVIPFPIMM